MSKDDATDNGQDLSLSPAEERLLEAYFRRRARPYFLALAGAIFVLGWIVVRGGVVPPNETMTMTSKARRQAATALATQRQATAALRSEVEHLRPQLAELAARPTPAETAKSGPTSDSEARRQLSTLDDQLAEALSRLATLETNGDTMETGLDELSSRTETVTLVAGDEATAALMKRVFDLELRVDKEETDRTLAQKNMLDRMFGLESRREAAEETALAAGKASGERLAASERRIHTLESRIDC